MMKKSIALLLAIFMLFGLVACSQDKQPKVEDQEAAVETPADEEAAANEEATDAEAEEEVVEEEVVEEEATEEGEEAESEEAAAEEVDEEELEVQENPGYEDPGFYTLNDTTGTTPGNWSPFTWETANDSLIGNWTTSSFYFFDYAPDSLTEGYTIGLDMAAEMPEDLTKEYAGKYNVPEDAEEGYVYRIKLIDYLMWEDETPIKAQDFVYSLKELLDPAAQNRRADEMYNGSQVVYNAKNYLYQGQVAPSSIREMAAREGFESVDAYLEKHGEDQAKINWANSFGAIYDTEKGEWIEEGFENAVVDAGMTINELRKIFLEKVQEWGEPEEKAIEFFETETFVDYEYPEVKVEELGLIAEDDNTLVLILDEPLVGFDFFYNLNLPLVNEKLYEANTVRKEGELTTSTYATSVDKTLSYGPYKLTKLQDDKIVQFDRNENWHGYKSGAFKGRYQMDRIHIDIVKEPATMLQMFLKGQTDFYALKADEVDQYKGSEYLYYWQGTYANCLQINRNLEALKAREEKGINKTILTIKNFRKALFHSLDVEDFVATTMAASVPGYGLINEQYIADTETFTPYRSYEPAKEALLDYLDIEYGEGKDYETIDDATAAMSSYDIEEAKKLFDEAYDEAIEKGLMKEGDKVVIDFSFGEDNEVARKRFNYLKENWQKAMKGTKLEGKFDMNYDATAGNDFAKNFKNGISDMVMAGWQGAQFNPFYLMSVYIMPDLRYDQPLDTTQEITVEIDGKEYTDTLEEMYNGVMGRNPDLKFGPQDVDVETRVAVLAALEKFILNEYASIPNAYGASAELKSQKIEYYTDEVHPLLRRGGATRIFFNYTDEEWEKYVKEQGGELDYK